MSKPAFREARWDEATEYSEDKSVLLGPDGWSCYLGEPEDRTWGRDGHGAVAMLNKQHAEITRLTAELTEMSARAREADAACTILGATNGETLIRAAQRVTVEARMVAVELAAARAVPPDVEAAIGDLEHSAFESGHGYGVADMAKMRRHADLRVTSRNKLYAAISAATASQPATVGGLLATAPDGVAETADGAQFRYIASKSPGVGRVEARSFRNAAWGAWSPSVIVAYYLRTPARPVPAHLADADPATRGPIVEVP